MSDSAKKAAAVMPAHAIAILIVRIWAIERFITSAFNIEGQRNYYLASLSDHDPGIRDWAIMGLAFHALFLVLAIVFFIFAPAVVRRLLPAPEEREGKLLFSITDAVQAAAFLMGLFLLGRFGPQMSYAIMHAVGQFYKDETPIYMGLSGGYPGFLAHLFLLIFSLWLLIRPAHVARLFAWLRTAGLPKEKPAQEEAGKAG